MADPPPTQITPSVPFVEPKDPRDKRRRKKRMRPVGPISGANGTVSADTEDGIGMEEEVGKPGTNWTQVSPEARARINPIVKHYGKMAHPFTACVRDNTKRFGKERAERICAVVKDMARQTTKWRKGPGKGRSVEAFLTDLRVELWTQELLEAAAGDVDGLERMMLVFIAEQEGVYASQLKRKRKRKRRPFVAGDQGPVTIGQG